MPTSATETGATCITAGRQTGGVPVESPFWIFCTAMSSAWLLPEHIADVLPHEARRIEELRRIMLDEARGYGYELVMPPLLEQIGRAHV